MWELLNKNINKDVNLKINNKEIRCKITSCDEFKDGYKWVSFSVYTNKELTPKIYGVNLGTFNSLYSPIDKRTYKGWFSDEVFETLIFIDSTETGVDVVSETT